MIGAHLSISKGIRTLQRQMEMLGSSTCAMFLKNQRQLRSKPMDEGEAEEFRRATKRPEAMVPHGSYLVNLANEDIAENSYGCLVDDLRRCSQLGIVYYNIHPGSDVKKIGERALLLIAAGINRALEEVRGVTVLLENMAGQGNVCGRTFEELAVIIENVSDKSRIGVTLDTCHLFGAGYDIRTAAGFEGVMEEFDRVVGMKYLKAVHLNDSKCALGSRRDRHEHIGEGEIGIEAFRYIMNSDRFEDIPMILETPDPARYKDELALLRSLETHDSGSK